MTKSKQFKIECRENNRTSQPCTCSGGGEQWPTQAGAVPGLNSWVWGGGGGAAIVCEECRCSPCPSQTWRRPCKLRNPPMGKGEVAHQGGGGALINLVLAKILPIKSWWPFAGWGDGLSPRAPPPHPVSLGEGLGLWLPPTHHACTWGISQFLTNFSINILNMKSNRRAGDG